jgi:hypothetical protein
MSENPVSEGNREKVIVTAGRGEEKEIFFPWEKKSRK